MKKKEMDYIIKSELKHLPRGFINSPQNYLRQYYSAFRRHDLAQNNPRGPYAILKEGIARQLENYPDFKPDFDKSFFI